MSPIEKLIGEPDDDPTDLSNAPFAFGRFPTGSESSAEYTLSSAPSQSQPPRKQAGLARPIPFATCGAELAVHERPQQMLYDYQPPSQQPDRYTPRHVPPVLEYLQGIQHGTRDYQRATTGEDFIPTPSRRSSPVNELTPASLDELESIDALAAARAGSPPPQGVRVPQQIVEAARQCLFICREAWRLVQQGPFGQSLPASQADEDSDAGEVMRLVNSIHEVVNSESTPESQADENTDGDEVAQPATTHDEVDDSDNRSQSSWVCVSKT
ncbi:hypothetical protein LEL_09754 [Akanthomyces lecanii RCEF 1005]|uniref:Uncharacterized protein n=1 Tax=Akanthomyces lecanii RCEF 1005 TaxID=1081108 RepID=A0A168BCR5_CORDF|nr:hypothetical protein LEL_09754 [Akanthomyces lecanii RCEF 1005]